MEASTKCEHAFPGPNCATCKAENAVKEFVPPGARAREQMGLTIEQLVEADDLTLIEHDERKMLIIAQDGLVRRMRNLSRGLTETADAIEKGEWRPNPLSGSCAADIQMFYVKASVLRDVIASIVDTRGAKK